jgi:hypothetical protein
MTRNAFFAALSLSRRRLAMALKSIIISFVQVTLASRMGIFKPRTSESDERNSAFGLIRAVRQAIIFEVQAPLIDLIELFGHILDFLALGNAFGRGKS